MKLPKPWCRSAWAFVVGAALLLPVAAAGEEIRVLFVPSEDFAVGVQTKALERAIAENSHSVRAVKDLAEAHVLLQFTDYRIEHHKKDGPWRWWDGRVKILLPADAGLKDAALASQLPERFSLVIMGEGGGNEMERTVATLEHFLRKSLRRDKPKRGADAI
jgi:hypothetical protein